MTPATGTALLVLVAFVLPGFVTILVKERIYEVPGEQQPFERLLQTLYYSLLVYSVPAVVAISCGADRTDFERFFGGHADPRATFAIAAAITLVLPIGLAYAGRRWMVSPLRPRLLGWLRVSITHRTPSSWDYAWEDEEPCLVVAKLKNGETIGGYYGNRSHSGYGSQHRDLFLEELWNVVTEPGGNMRFEPAEGTLGVWVSADEIVHVERYGVSDAQVQELRD